MKELRTKHIVLLLALPVLFAFQNCEKSDFKNLKSKKRDQQYSKESKK